MLLIAFILFIWFESDLLITLIKISKLDKFLFLQDYEKEKLLVSDQLTYLDYLHVRKQNFFIKLISCPICLCFWLTLIYSFIIYNSIFLIIKMFALHYFVNLSVYLLVKKLYGYR